MHAVPRIDAHQHFWRFNAVEYAWIDDPMAALRRDFLPRDLRPLLETAGFDGCVAVQTRPSNPAASSSGRRSPGRKSRRNAAMGSSIDRKSTRLNSSHSH